MNLSQSQPLLFQQPPHRPGPIRYQQRGQKADLEHYDPEDSSQPLEIHSSRISWPEQVPLCLAALEDLLIFSGLIEMIFSPTENFSILQPSPV